MPLPEVLRRVIGSDADAVEDSPALARSGLARNQAGAPSVAAAPATMKDRRETTCSS